MTSFGHENDFFSTIVGRAENVSSTSYIGGNNVFFMTKWRNFHDVQNTTIVLQISTSIAHSLVEVYNVDSTSVFIQ